MNKQKQAFTLVELIVVITILAILWTIAFLSLQWYSAQARDSKRIADISNIKKSLEFFSLQVWKYPLWDNAENVSYSGWISIVWQQWTIWDWVVTNLSRNLSKKPVDPLYGTEYIYSTIENRSEYEIMSVYEWNIASTTNVLNTANAAWELSVKVEWTYNQLFVRTSDYVIPTPSIITSLDISWGLDFDAQAISSQVINGWTNIPDVWNTQVKVSTWALSDLTLSVYNGSINTQSSGVEKLAVMQAIQATYTGSSLATNSLYKDLLKQTTDEELVYFTDLVVLNTKPNSCNALTKPTDNGHITYILKPSYKNQWYTKWSSECWFTCTDWYVWESCEYRGFPDPATWCTKDDEPVLYSLMQENQSTIYSNISDYIWCSIPDFPGWAARIVWTTVWSKIHVISTDAPPPSLIQWWCEWIQISWADSADDGLQNTIDILTWCSTPGIAADICNSLWNNWYLPAKNELTDINNKWFDINITSTEIFWSSTEASNSSAIRRFFNINFEFAVVKWATNGTVFCSNRF